VVCEVISDEDVDVEVESKIVSDVISSNTVSEVISSDEVVGEVDEDAVVSTVAISIKYTHSKYGTLL